MARRSADRGVAPVAVLGAASTAGAGVKAALADRGVSGDRVALYGPSSDVAVLSEYDGEARLVQPSEEFDATACAVVFVCERGPEAARLPAAGQAGTLILDLTSTVTGATLHDGIAPPAGTRLVAFPHPLALLVGSVLRPLHRAVGVRRADAFLIRPASDFGEPGLEELREQTVHLLRFESTPTEIFGRQLAFNVVPEHLFPESERGSSRRIAAESAALAGSPAFPVTVSQALVPTFLGHGLALHVETVRASASDAAAAMAASTDVTFAPGGEPGATMDAPDGPTPVVARLDAPEEGIVRVWCVASEAVGAVASRAVSFAAAAGVL